MYTAVDPRRLVRTNIAIDAGIAHALSDESAKENKTLYALANEFLEACLRVCREGGHSREIYPSWRFMKLLREIDSVPLPGSLVERMVKHLYTLDKEWILQTWHDEGARVGTYLKMFSKLENLGEVVGEFQAFLPVKRLEFEKGEDASGRTQFLIRAIGAGLSTESTSCAEQFIIGIISAYSLRVVKSKITEGIIEVTAAKESARA